MVKNAYMQYNSYFKKVKEWQKIIRGWWESIAVHSGLKVYVTL